VPPVTAPPFAFAAIAVICAHQSKRRDAARIFLLTAAYLELFVFALTLGIGVNSINGGGWGE
jgi:Na+/H+-dicarboxylate symporter